MRRGIAALLLAAGLGVVPAAAQVQLGPGYDDLPARGPASAVGAVIYSHGLARDGDEITTTPYVVDDLQAAGWDVFRFLRARADDTLEGSVPTLAEVMRKLRGDGYKKIVLIGQSFGGWISLAAAQDRRVPVDAVIALAPAAFGRRDDPHWTENAAALYRLAETTTARRVLVFLFDGDDYDPGGRGEELREIFQRRGLAAAVVDGPHDLTGHSAGLTHAFGRRFGPCLRAFIEATQAVPLFACPDPQSASLADFEMPADVQVATPAPGTEPGLAAMAGRWYGAYENGRDVLLVLTEIDAARARAVYAFGPVVRGIGTPTGYTQRRGAFDPATGILRFAEPQADNVIECRLLADDVMELAIGSWVRGERQRAVLRLVH